MTSDLPPGWAWTTVADVADVQLGRQRSPQHHQGEQMRPYLRAANVTWQGINLDDVNEMNFDDVDFEKYKLASGDILLNEASGSPHEVGKPAIWANEIEGCCFQNTLLRLRPQLVDRNYLYWYCYASALTGRFGEAGRGVNIRHLGKRGLARFPIPVAPTAEQKRIVAAIEEHLSRLDAADESMAAPSLRGAQILESLLQTELRTAKLHNQPLSDFLTEPLANGRSVPTAEEYGFPVLRLTCLKDGRVDTAETKQGHFGEIDHKRYQVESGDFLISRGNGSLHLVGIGGLVPHGAHCVAYPDTLIRARVDRSRLRPEFLSLIWNSRTIRRQLESQARTTAGIYKVNQSMIGDVLLPAPSPDVQDRIAQRLELVRQTVLQLDAEVDRYRSRSASLRRSILATAFSGRLVPQNLDEESASALLERIAASRTTKPRQPRVPS